MYASSSVQKHREEEPESNCDGEKGIEEWKETEEKGNVIE